MAAAIGVALLVACSLEDLRSGNRDDAGAAPPDAEAGAADVDAAIDADAGPAAPRCNPSAPFGDPVPVTGVPVAVSSFALTAKEDLAFYVSDKQGVLFATPTSPTAMGPATKVSIAFTAGPINTATISGDLRTIFFESAFHLWRAAGEARGPYLDVTAVNDDGQLHGQPYLDEAHGTLWASSYVDAGLYRQIVRAPVDSGALGTFADVPLGPESTHSPVAGNDGTTLFVGSARGNLPVSDDVFRVTNLGADASLERLPVINSASFDIPLWLSRDDCLLYIGTSRRTGFDREVFVARRGM